MAGLVNKLLETGLLLLDPWLFMLESLRHLPQTVAGLVSQGEYGTLLSPAALSEALFGNFWAAAGPQVKQAAEPRVVPLLEGRVSGGVARDHVVGVPVHGVVVEVGAGSGMWADVFARLRDAESGPGGDLRHRSRAGSRITKIYGVEPHPQSAAALGRRVREVGLDDVYEVVPVGIEALGDPAAWSGRIAPGSVDCIVGVLCLCSIPDPEANIRHLYALLKPGGCWYVYEHVKVSRGGPLMNLYQRIVNIPWSFFVGSCRICRPTDKTLLAAGSWQHVDLVQPPDQSPFQVLPHVLGTLTK